MTFDEYYAKEARDARDKEVLDILKEADNALSDLREKAKAEGNIYLSKKITMQMIRIELAISYIEDEEEESND